MTITDQYYEKIIEYIDRIRKEEYDNIKAAAELMKEQIKRIGLSLHTDQVATPTLHLRRFFSGLAAL